jgi:hypothetical protein
MYVICFYWQGDRWQQEGYREEESHVNYLAHHLRRVGQIPNYLPAAYINNLYRGVRQFTDREFQFICFTNEPLKLDSGIEVRQFPMLSRSGVLPRLFMFSREAGLFGSQVLCLDVDVVVVGSLKGIMSYDGLFCARSKFKPGEEWRLDGDVMSFRADEESEQRFWYPFVENIQAAEQLTQGRERYWIRHVANDIADRWDRMAPGAIVSYKWHVKKRKQPPAGAAIVSCHGVPRPHEIRDGWIKQYWNVD